ncbi:MAG: PLP-dependent transferase [Ruminococcus sp.]|nr:PLP-dependent transferase [Ruminococcus sp.]
MNTPICDFVSQYAGSGFARLHMPGHKGTELLGCEAYDITEITGADSLYEASGIIKESEANASALFGCNTFYSTEGSSLCIRAMLYLALLHAKENVLSNTVLAGRNAHKAFLSAAVLLDLQVKWMYGTEKSTYLSCSITPEYLDELLSDCEQKPMAVYITSPDYLGNISDIRGLSEVCRKHGVLLLADNAHGAYLKFLPCSLHPIDSGADMCCDSAHKTLPVLTGGAYLHISESAPSVLAENAKDALSLFGSTSPSYLILQSLDMANKYLSEHLPEELSRTCKRVRNLKDRLTLMGYSLYGNEDLKITIEAKPFGYTGTQLAEILRENSIECEFSDPDFLVLMLTPQSGDNIFSDLEAALARIPQKAPIACKASPLGHAETVMSARQAMLSRAESIPVSESVGRVLACTCVSCPPAVPVVVCGERITPQAVSLFEYYNIKTCKVIKE